MCNEIELLSVSTHVAPYDLCVALVLNAAHPVVYCLCPPNFKEAAGDILAHILDYCLLWIKCLSCAYMLCVHMFSVLQKHKDLMIGDKDFIYFLPINPQHLSIKLGHLGVILG